MKVQKQTKVDMHLSCLCLPLYHATNLWLLMDKISKFMCLRKKMLMRYWIVSCFLKRLKLFTFFCSLLGRWTQHCKVLFLGVGLHFLSPMLQLSVLGEEETLQTTES